MGKHVKQKILALKGKFCWKYLVQIKALMTLGELKQTKNLRNEQNEEIY
jgi:hypothetical protein